MGSPPVPRIWSIFEPYLAGASLGLCLFPCIFPECLQRKSEIYVKFFVMGILFLLLMLTFSLLYVAIILSLIALFMKQKNMFYWYNYWGYSLFLQYSFQNQLVGVQLFRTFSVDTRIQMQLRVYSLEFKTPSLASVI